MSVTHVTSSSQCVGALPTANTGWLLSCAAEFRGRPEVDDQQRETARRRLLVTEDALSLDDRLLDYRRSFLYAFHLLALGSLRF